MYQIDLCNSQERVGVDETFLQEVARRTLEAEQVASAVVSVALVDNAAIHELNRQYLQHDYETDVLSFLLDCEPPATDAPAAQTGGAASTPRGAGKRIEGEVIVSVEMAAQTAEGFRWSAQDETVLYLVHGLLHLCGYDDLTPGEKRVMRAREREILRLWGLTPHYADPEVGNEES